MNQGNQFQAGGNQPPINQPGLDPPQPPAQPQSPAPLQPDPYQPSSYPQPPGQPQFPNQPQPPVQPPGFNRPPPTPSRKPSKLKTTLIFSFSLLLLLFVVAVLLLSINLLSGSGNEIANQLQMSCESTGRDELFGTELPQEELPPAGEEWLACSWSGGAGRYVIMLESELDDVLDAYLAGLFGSQEEAEAACAAVDLESAPTDAAEDSGVIITGEYAILLEDTSPDNIGALTSALEEASLDWRALDNYTC